MRLVAILAAVVLLAAMLPPGADASEVRNCRPHVTLDQREAGHADMVRWNAYVATLGLPPGQVAALSCVHDHCTVTIFFKAPPSVTGLPSAAPAASTGGQGEWRYCYTLSTDKQFRPQWGPCVC
ncbi:MAG: hypothetical protein AB7O45_04130 [Alphaproteobacteria bacterium]